MKERSPVPGLLAPVAGIASRVYGQAITRRNRRFDSGAGVQRVSVPVISVGNLSVGGVGKSPMVRWIVQTLLAGGHRPVIAMRGYGAKAGVGAGTMSDEQLEHEATLDGVPVVANPRRHEALSAFLPRRPEVDCVVLDDGFQHRQLHRDLDITLIDATAGTFGDRLLPAGFLREPLTALARADAVVMTHAERVDDELAAAVATHHGRRPVAWTDHAWTGLQVYDGEDHDAERAGRTVPVDWLSGRRVLTLLGIGRPALVRDRVARAGGELVVDVPARDHQAYTPGKLRRVRDLCREVDAVVTTGKDWVKLQHLVDFSTWPVPIVVPKLEIQIVAGEAELRRLVEDAVSRKERLPCPR